MGLRGMLRWVRDRLPPQVGKAACGLCAVLEPHGRQTFSQEGEDVLLLRLFGARPSGFYVDVGAHHPERFSNTSLFYRMGWRGINIDPNPDAIALFARCRKADINLCIGISDTPGNLVYHVFDDAALNTFDERLAAERAAQGPYRILRTFDVQVERLDVVLARHLPPGRAVDFLSVDAEGFDLRVLQSNDWSRFRPGCVLAEAQGTSLAAAAGHPVSALLQANGYELHAKLANTLLFRDSRRTWE